MKTSKPKAAVSWSGGKDSYLTLHRAAGAFDVQALITMFTKDGTRSRSHGLRPEEVAWQASPLVTGRGSWKAYEEEFKRVLRQLAYKPKLSQLRRRYSTTSGSGQASVRRCSQQFESLDLDTCGERGEYHTLMFASSRMSSPPLELQEVGRLIQVGYWMLDLGLRGISESS